MLQFSSEFGKVLMQDLFQLFWEKASGIIWEKLIDIVGNFRNIEEVNNKKKNYLIIHDL
jgi:hypothetical protein